MKNIIVSQIRNFAIIAHIDHGKSTLADRFLELTGVIDQNHDSQFLDRNPISRERGITIKLAPVSMIYSGIPNSIYLLNLVDTPGHVDFSYEVERTLACVEGAILLVDATQGIQAQTISHTLKALGQNLKIIPVVNKIDSPQAQVPETVKALSSYLGVSEESVFKISAKTGVGVSELLSSIIKEVPQPKTGNSSYPEALIFDSYYDEYRGVIAFVKVNSGKLTPNQTVKLAGVGTEIEIAEVGIFKPNLYPEKELSTGQIGYVVTNLKDIHKVQIGDSLIDPKTDFFTNSGYKKVKPMIFANIFTIDPADYPNLKKALEKLYLNDSALEFSPIYSKALGSGFRVGFLGMLHADVSRERLEREFGQSLILTPAQVDYQYIEGEYQEPMATVTIVTPDNYLGTVMALCKEARANFINMNNIVLSNQKDNNLKQMVLVYEMPLYELVTNFFDRLKNATSGYASLDWEFSKYEPVKAEKLELLLNNEPVEEFSEIVVSEKANEKARALVTGLKELINRQQFEIRIQGRYRGKIIASEHLSALRKNVLMKHSKVVGAGDYGRKKKLLDKQKEGKKKMKLIGKVEIPKETFLKLFKLK